jgi:hypothetical protein
MLPDSASEAIQRDLRRLSGMTGCSTAVSRAISAMPSSVLPWNHARLRSPFPRRPSKPLRSSSGATGKEWRWSRAAAAPGSRAAQYRSTARSSSPSSGSAVFDHSTQRWRIEVEAGLTTGHVHRLARESGLMFPPDPGAAEQSQIGGIIATNAGGPHTFKYGVVGDFVMGIEGVMASGELITLGGANRKDVAPYDIKRLLIGSEGPSDSSPRLGCDCCQLRRQPSLCSRSSRTPRQAVPRLTPS